MISKENDATDLNILYWNMAPIIRLKWYVINLNIKMKTPIKDDPIRTLYNPANKPSATPELPGVVGIIITTINRI